MNPVKMANDLRQAVSELAGFGPFGFQIDTVSIVSPGSVFVELCLPKQRYVDIAYRPQLFDIEKLASVEGFDLQCGSPKVVRDKTLPANDPQCFDVKYWYGTRRVDKISAP